MDYFHNYCRNTSFFSTSIQAMSLQRRADHLNICRMRTNVHPKTNVWVWLVTVTYAMLLAIQADELLYDVCIEDGMLVVKTFHTYPLMIGTYTDQILKYIHLKMQILTVLSQVCYTLQKLKHDNCTKFPLESYQIRFW